MADATPEDRLIDHLTDYPEEVLDETPVDDPEPPLEAAGAEVEDEISDEEGGSEGSDDEPVEVELEPDEFVSLDYEGVTYEIPKALQKGFTQEADYTQKSQTLSDNRREFEFVQKQMDATKSEYEFAASIQNELTQIAQMDSYLQQAGQLNWQEMTTDEMVRARHDMDMIKDQKATLVEGLSAKQTEFQETQKQSLQELLDKGAEVLKNAIPGWDETKQKEMRGYAINDGYTEQEIANVTDPRFVRTLWKASQFDKLQAGAEGAKVKLKQAPTIKAKSRKTSMSKEKGRELNLRKKLNSPNISSRQKQDAMIDSGVIADRFG